MLGRKITAAEYEQATAVLDELDFENGWVQDYEGEDEVSALS
jgi:hypothetical protein